MNEYEYIKYDKAFKELKETALTLNHYQLADITELNNPLGWKEYLKDQRTVEYITSEMQIIRTAAINEMVQNAPDSKSVGQSQLINALQKIDEQSNEKTGPVFIYTFVPLNKEQQEAPNVDFIKDTVIVRRNKEDDEDIFNHEEEKPKGLIVEEFNTKEE